MREKITIYTDGACSGNPGVGGWGAILVSGGRRREISGGEEHTTNNRMELSAVIGALRALKIAPSEVELFTDSKYVKDGITEWIGKWRKNGWKTSSKKPVKNEDLWRALAAEVARHDIIWHWLKGHAGHEENERADLLARLAIGEIRSRNDLEPGD